MKHDFDHIGVTPKPVRCGPSVEDEYEDSDETMGGDTVPYVVESGAIKSLHFAFDAIQSRLDSRRPERLTLRYTRTMMAFLLFSSQPPSVAMIGLGGGSLARFIHRHLPQTLLKVVEINPAVLELRREFLIPDDGERFRVRLGDGAEFVRSPPRCFDVLMVDGFDVTGQPSGLASESFYADCSASLADDGVLVVNLCPAYAGYEQQIAAIARVFSDNALAVYDDQCSNTIVFASRVPLTKLFSRHGWQCKRTLPANAFDELASELRRVETYLRRERDLMIDRI